MTAVINTNVSSLNAQRNLTTNQASLAQTLQRLSSGLRINSAKDDAAGLAISERFTAQIRGLNQAARNASDGISLAQTTEGAMQASNNILQRIRELAVQSANASNSGGDRVALQQEVAQLVAELERISLTTEFNGQKLLDGTFGTQQFQVGANANQTIVAATANLRTTVYGNNQAVGVGASGASAAVSGSANGVIAGTAVINGFIGSAQITNSINATAKSIAASVNNQTLQTGVVAEARTEVQLNFTASGAFTLALDSSDGDSRTVSFSVSATSTKEGLSNAVAAINEQTAKTGIVAAIRNFGGNDRIVLSNMSGADINVSDTGVVNGGDVEVFKLDAAGATTGPAITLNNDTTAEFASVSGYLLLDSEKSFSVSVAAPGGMFAASVASTLQSVSTLDVSSFELASRSIKVVDAALAFINGERAKLGALQSRFETTIANLQIQSENMSASRSRILDADYARETANLSRTQILQQAGVAMVAQANQLPRNVLQLLQQ